MSQVIKSGKTGNTADVDDEGRLLTKSVSEDISVDSALKGAAFFLTTGVIDLTSSNESQIIYVKNNDTVDWVVRDFNTVVNQSVGAPDLEVMTRFTISPTGGTIVSGANFIPANLNLGDSKSLAGVFKVGGEGFTVSGGISVPQNMYLPNRNNPAASANPIIVAPGTGFAFAIEPATGNTSLKVVFNATVYRDMTEA